MISTIAALLVVAPSTPEGQWGSTTLTPLALATKVDHALATLTGVTMHFVYVFDTTAAYGMKACDGTFISPTKFRVQVPAYYPNREPMVDYETWVADGTRFGGITASAYPKAQMPLARRPAGPAHPATAWFGDFSRIMLSGIGRESHPVEGFVRDAKGQGFGLNVQMRQLTLGGALRTWYRLVATKGVLRYETVFDATGYLPVNVVNTKGPKNRARWYEVRWSKPKKIDLTAARFTQPKSVTKS